MSETASYRCLAGVEQLPNIRSFVEEALAGTRTDPEAVYDLLQAVEEAVTNILVHGYQGEPGELEVEVWQAGESLVARLRDQAPAFDPNTVPEPDLSLPLEKRPFGGLGIHLIRQFTDEIRYRPLPQGGNELILIKKINTDRLNSQEGRDELHH